MSWVESEIWQTWWFSRLPTSHVRLQAAIKCRVTLSAPVANIQNIKKEAGNSPGYQWDARVFQCLSNSQQLFHHVFGVDAVKGPCAVFIFLFFCVLVVFVFVGWVWGVGGDVNVLLHFHAYVMLRCCTSSCTSTHTSCYEREQLSLLMVAKLGKEPPINKCQKNASNGKTLPTTAVSLWSTCEEAHKKEFFFGRNTDFRQTVGLVKNTIPRQLHTHKDCRQDFKKIGKSLAQERQWQCPEQPRTTFWCLKRKKELFGEALDEQNSCFVLVKH